MEKNEATRCRYAALPYLPLFGWVEVLFKRAVLTSQRPTSNFDFAV